MTTSSASSRWIAARERLASFPSDAAPNNSQPDSAEACAEVFGRLKGLFPKVARATASSLLSRFQGPELDLRNVTEDERTVIQRMTPEAWGDLQLQAMALGGKQITSITIGPDLIIDKTLIAGMKELAGVEHVTFFVADDATRLDLGTWQGTNAQREQTRLANIRIGGTPKQPLDIIIPRGVLVEPLDGAGENLLTSKVWKTNEHGIADAKSEAIPLRNAHDLHWAPAPRFQFRDMPGDDYFDPRAKDGDAELVFPEVERPQAAPDELEIASHGVACAMFACDGFSGMMKDLIAAMRPGQSGEFCLASEGRPHMRLRLELNEPNRAGGEPTVHARLFAQDYEFPVWKGVASKAGQAAWKNHEPEAVVRVYPLGAQGTQLPISGKPAIYMSATRANSAQALVAALHTGSTDVISDAVATYGAAARTDESKHRVTCSLRSPENPLPPEMVVAFVRAVVQASQPKFDLQLKFILLRALFEGVTPSREMGTTVTQAVLHATRAQLPNDVKVDLLEVVLRAGKQAPQGQDPDHHARASFEWACACMKEISHSLVLSGVEKAAIALSSVSYGANLPGVMMGILESDAQPQLKLWLLDQLSVDGTPGAVYDELQAMLESLDLDSEDGELQRILVPVLRKFDAVRSADSLLQGNALVHPKGTALQVSADAHLKAERTVVDEEGNTLVLCSATQPIAGLPPAKSLSRFATDVRPWLYLLYPSELERRILPRTEIRAARRGFFR
jgi:hypothetical protein